MYFKYKYMIHEAQLLKIKSLAFYNFDVRNHNKTVIRWPSLSQISMGC